MADDDLLVRAANGEFYRLACVDLGGNLRRLKASGAGSSSWPDGTAAAPGAFFAADTTTGLYRFADGSIGLSVKGTLAFKTGFVAGTIVNNITAYPSATGNAVSLAAEGSDTNLALALTSKGNLPVYINKAAQSAGSLGLGVGAANTGLWGTATSLTVTVAGWDQVSFGNVASAVDRADISGSTTTVKTIRYGAAGSDANIGIAVVPVGTGALSAAVPDSTATGGNARGANAVDWQQSRGAASQAATGASSAIGGGSNSTASGSNAVVAGGNTNTASGANAAVSGGILNTANGADSWVPGGAQATTRGHWARGAWSAGQFATVGDAQAGEYLLRAATTDATVTRLISDGGAASSSNTINLPNSGSYRVRMMALARQTGGVAGTAGDTASWEFSVTMKRGAAAVNTAFVGGIAQTATPGLAAIVSGTGFAPDINDAAAAAWRVTIAADTTNGGIAVSGTGEASKNIQWVARVLSVETVG